MTPLKETLEVGESLVSQGTARPKVDSTQVLSDAVSLDVPVRVHGSRVVEVVRGAAPHTEPFEEQTSTMIVFPLGGVLKMSTLVSVGQAIVLTNLKTRQEAICRVVKIRTNPNLHSYVEVEFSHPQPGYWGVRFPSDGPELPKKAASPVTGASSPLAPVTPGPAPKSVLTLAPKIETPKIEASKTETPKIEVTERKSAPMPPPAPVPTPPAPRAQAPIDIERHVFKAVPQPNESGVDTPAPNADSASFSLEELRGDAPAAPRSPFWGAARVEPAGTQETEFHGQRESSTTDEPATSEPSTFGRFRASHSSEDEPAAARRAFGAGLEYSPVGAESEKRQSQGKNWMRTAALVGLSFAAAGGGGFYFLEKRPATHLVQATIPVTPQPAIAGPSNAMPTTPAPTQPAGLPVTPSAREVSPPSTPPPLEARAHQAEPNRLSKPVPAKAVQTPDQTSRPESPRQNSATVVPDMFGALNAHPSAAVHTNTPESGAAPSIEAGALAGQSVALPSTEPSPVNLAPPPQPTPEGPVVVGGEVKAPQPISSGAVAYPEIARQAGVEGNVIVRIVIDKTGKVTDAKVLSGPMLLRDAAVSSLRDRKYKPSTLNGHPISVEMLVTIQFRR
jgi:periplasmic protein TonB